VTPAVPFSVAAGIAFMTFKRLILLIGSVAECVHASHELTVPPLTGRDAVTQPPSTGARRTLPTPSGSLKRPNRKADRRITDAVFVRVLHGRADVD
jgi:hypothetical protein